MVLGGWYWPLQDFAQALRIRVPYWGSLFVRGAVLLLWGPNRNRKEKGNYPQRFRADSAYFSAFIQVCIVLSWVADGFLGLRAYLEGRGT